MKTLLAATAALGLLVMAAPASAAELANGISINGILSNGIQINGIQINGMKRNGLRLNGMKNNGTALNGAAAPAPVVQSVRLPGGATIAVH